MANGLNGMLQGEDSFNKDESIDELQQPGESEGKEPEGKEPEGKEPEGKEKAASLTKQIEELLLAGVPEDEIIAQGYNSNSVRIVAYDLDKAGKRKRPSKAVAKSGGSQMTSVKSMPPEVLVDNLSVPTTVNPEFEKGMKFGMGCMILGVRLAQEMSAIGVQQAKPLVEMAKDMRSGEQSAAKNATVEAAGIAAQHVGQSIIPILQGMDQRLKELETPEVGGEKASNPLAGMMVNMVQNLFKGMMSQMMPGMQDNSPGIGWSKRSE